MRRPTITKVTPGWVRKNGTEIPMDGLAAATTFGAGSRAYKTPLGYFVVDTASRVRSVDADKVKS